MENKKYTVKDLSNKYILTAVKQRKYITNLVQYLRLLGIDDDDILDNKFISNNDIVESLEKFLEFTICELFEVEPEDVSISFGDVNIYRVKAFKLTNPLMHEKMLSTLTPIDCLNLYLL